jgi:putative ABC transport system permease protein
VRVKDALDAINDVMRQLAFAIRAASSIALGASILVLGGALAAGQQARIYDVVILKTLGATRWRLLGALIAEYAILGVSTAIFGVLAGAGAAALIITKVMRLDGFVWLWPAAASAAGLALLLTVGLGLAATWRVLGQKPAQHLRSL